MTAYHASDDVILISVLHTDLQSACGLAIIVPAAQML